MFRGSFEHTVDTKGRVSVPSKFRDLIADRYEMVHGQLYRFERFAAIIAYPARPFPLPPLRCPELARLALLALDVLFVGCKEKRVGHSKIKW